MQHGTETRIKSVELLDGDVMFRDKRIHLIGIGGSGMRALAEMLMHRGAIVSGSDASSAAALERLAADGATIHVGQKADNLPEVCDTVVFSAAINEQNPELLAARQRKCEVIKYSQMLGRLMAEKVGVAVSGTHGKSTTTAMVAYVLTMADMKPNFIVGATVEQLGGPSGVGPGRHFVAEACEYDRSFLNYRPTYAAILNVEEDHLDCYPNITAIIEAFRAFVSQVKPEGVVIANGEDRNVAAATKKPTPCEVQTFGMAEGCTWRGEDICIEKGRHVMDIYFKGHKYARLHVPLPGKHNMYNSLAATALLHHSGLSADTIVEHLSKFTGTRRRMTLKAQINGITVVDDYAHHPTEIQATLRAIREFYQPRGRVYCVFQPHQHSRTRFLLKDFARCFGGADEVVVPDIYFVRDSEMERDCISSEDLVAQIRLNGGTALYLKSSEEIVRHLQGALSPDDLVVTMGAGNIWEVADEIVCWLGSNR